MKDERKNKMLVMCFLALVSLVFAMQSNSNLWYNGEIGTDSSVFRTVAWLMSKGYMPYRDTFDHKGPLIYILNLIGMSFSYLRGIWVIECLVIFGTFFMIYKIARLLCERFMSCIVVLMVGAELFRFYDGGNLVEEYAMPLLAVSLYIFGDYFLNGNINKWRLFVCGASLGGVCMLRPNMIAVWLVFSIAVFIHCIRKKEKKEILVFLGWFMVGLCTIIFPIIIWIGIGGAWNSFITDYIMFNLVYTGEMTSSNFLSSRFGAFSFFSQGTLTLLSIVIMVYLCTKKNQFFHITYFVCMVVSLVFASISGMRYGHYGMTIIPLLTYPLSVMCFIFEKEIKAKRELASMMLMFISVMTIVLPWLNGVERTIQCFDSRNENKISEMTNSVIDFVYNNTTENEKISVFGNWNIIYVLTQREPASVYSYQLPIANVDSTIMIQYINDLKEEIPKLLIVQETPEIDMTMLLEFIEEYEYEPIVYTGDGKKVTIYMKT